MYDHLKAFVLDPSVRKVVVIAHSQGGLVLSMVLDRMYADLPCDQMSKLVGVPNCRIASLGLLSDQPCGIRKSTRSAPLQATSTIH
jgi:hypothetical protein